MSKETDFLYISARVRAMETSLLPKERLYRMAEARSAEEALSLLAEAGIPTVTSVGRGGAPVPDVEATLFAPLASALEMAEKETPDPRLFDFIRLPYDVCNLKAAIKCRFAGCPTEGMMFPCGRVPEEDVLCAVETRDFSAFPPHMAAAADRAMTAYAEARDPRAIDLILDRACYLDMEDAVKKDAFLADLVACKVDLVNLMTRLRVLRGNAPDGLFFEAFLPGGTLGESFFREAENETALFDRLRLSPVYANLFDADPAKCSFAELEKAEDEFYAARASRAKYVGFGPAVVGAYLVAREIETKNLRILFASLGAGVPADGIRDRLRNSCI